ncbi:MAG: helix-turn-helix transcriptional regulator [Stellaceae bacterium]
MIADPANRELHRNAAAEAAAPEDDRFIGTAELYRLMPVSQMTIWRWMHDPRVGFPAATKLGANGRNYWRLAEVRAWMESRPKKDVAAATAA